MQVRLYPRASEWQFASEFIVTKIIINMFLIKVNFSPRLKFTLIKPI